MIIIFRFGYRPLRALLWCLDREVANNNNCTNYSFAYNREESLQVWVNMRDTLYYCNIIIRWWWYHTDILWIVVTRSHSTRSSFVLIRTRVGRVGILLCRNIIGIISYNIFSYIIIIHIVKYKLIYIIIY